MRSEMYDKSAFNLLCLVVYLITCCTALEYIKHHAGLKDIPDNISLNVTSIDLRLNELVVIQEHAFSRFTELQQLELSNNKITKISPVAFMNTQIKQLYLKKNQLMAVPDVCVLSETLEILNMASNNIQTVNPQHINCLKNIKNLFISDNSLVAVPNICILSESLESLKLGSNNIQTVDPQLINCLTNIRELTLRDNPFTRLPEDTFDGLKLLEELDLTYTGISSLPVLTNVHLTRLEIYNTRITTFPDPVLSNSQIDIMWITDKQLVCNCSVAWMFMYNQRHWPLSISEQPRPCKSPPAFTEIAWRELTISDLCTGDINLWEITYQKGPSTTIRFQTRDSTFSSPVDHYVLQYSNVNEVDWMNGTTVTATGNCDDFITVTQDGLDPGIFYMMRVIPAISGSIQDYKNQACPQSAACHFLHSEDIITVCACAERHSNETCYLEKHESCFYNKHFSNSDTTEVPHIQMVCPSYGPQSGKTDVSIWGRQLDQSELRIILGHLPCQVIFSNATYLKCITSNGTGLVSIGEPQDMIFNFKQQAEVKRVTIEDVFTFRRDPEITSIDPVESFTKGGVNITVSGNDLDSVARALLEIRLIYINVQKQDTFASICITLNSTRITCKSPEVILREGFSTQDFLDELNRNNGSHMDKNTEKDARIPVNQDDLRVLVSVKMDAVHKSDEFILYDLSPDIHSFPEKNSVRLFMPKWPSYDNHLSIKGMRLDYGCSVDDYIVLVGGQACSVTHLLTNTLTCIPPLTKPKATEDNYLGNPVIKVFVGNIVTSPGFLHYGSVWEHKTFLIAFIVGMCVVVPLISGIVIYLICRRFCHKKNASTASPSVQSQGMYRPTSSSGHFTNVHN